MGLSERRQGRLSAGRVSVLDLLGFEWEQVPQRTEPHQAPVRKVRERGGIDRKEAI